MKLVPSLSSQWETVGFLYSDSNRASLGEDMFAAWLSDGTTISAGWSCEGDVDGSYEVCVTRGFDELIPSFTTQSMEAAASRVEAMAMLLWRNHACRSH